MNDQLRRFANAFGIGFATFFLFAFLPLLFLLPAILSIALTLGSDGLAFLWLIAVFCTVPFGGYLSLVVFGQPGDRLHNFLSLTGLWLGILAGSVAGMRMTA